jgi:stearoyl-CoA desaturase (delta-9 desaturase)
MSSPSTATTPIESDPDAQAFYSKIPAVPKLVYWGLHILAAITLIWVRPTAEILVLTAATFWIRMIGITGFYHRYFSHKTYKTSRVFQFVMAWVGASCTQKGPLWWAGIHRIHHRESDVPGKDPHSPKDGFWYSHAGWIQDPRWDATPIKEIRDFARFPELQWLNRWHFVPPLVLVAGIWLTMGGTAVLWAYVVSTVVLWHSTYTINSLSHVFGTRRYETNDTSRNNLWLALLTLGEGWHNNHHRYMASCRQGFFWWEIDPTYYVLKGMQKVGLIWDIREPPAHLLETQQELQKAA